MCEFEVLQAGAMTTIQDLGRPGFAHLGVPHSGAADTDSLRLANRLVGNPDNAAALETTLTGPRLRLMADCTIAVTGATVIATVDGRGVPMNERVHVAAGETVKLGVASRGLRNYIAFQGGVDVPSVFGSRSTDVLTLLGAPPLKTGDRIPIGIPKQARRDADAPEPTVPAQEPSLGVILGPRDDRFPAEAVRLLTSAEFTVSPDSNRIGVRLTGQSLPMRGSDAIRSEGIAHGSLQVPPDGNPILLLCDHPTTGGYPVIAVVSSSDLPVAGQLRPGQTVRFHLAEEHMRVGGDGCSST
jgi:biotin-dependent carboxylase-like uncharacterized protein